VTWWQALLLVFGGLAAGVINTMAGGGSSLTVPLLVLAGVPGNVANGSNRVGILTSNAAAVAGFRRLGVDGLTNSLRAVVPAVVGSIAGSFGISRLTDETFETLFGLLMIPIILMTIFKPKPRASATEWPIWQTVLVFLGVGIYGGAIQAGVGLVMLTALSRSGYDLVTANAVKVLVTLAITMAALPVFIYEGNVRWLPAAILAVGLTIGGWLGARITVAGGEKWVRIVATVAALALAGKLLGFYG